MDLGDDVLKDKVKDGQPLFFENDILPIFKNRCYTCHDDFDPYFNSTDYEDVKRNINGIWKYVVIKKTMPEDGPMPQVERDIVEKWEDTKWV